ncbi:MAG: hypothetical protein ACFFHV_11410 [Promethearchaeota archaeon]
MNENNSNIPFNKDQNEYPKSSASNLTSYITGEGVNQPVRVYMKNVSKSIGNEEAYFDIAAPADNMYLDYGDFRFGFNNNYTTEYIVEESSALNPITSYFENYPFVEGSSNIIINEGVDGDGGYSQVVDENSNTYWNISTNGANSVDFITLADFTGASQSGGRTDLPFDKDNIVGLILNFTYSLSNYANVTVQIRDFHENQWSTIIDNVEINYTLGRRHIDKLIVNKNLRFINDSDSTLIRFIFNRTDTTDFFVLLREFDLSAIVVFELPIATNNWVALELDLRGTNSTINGFYAWIRTLDLDQALFGHLNISLYRANSTMKPTTTNLRSVNLHIEPDLSQLLDSMIIEFDDYHGDQLTYFKFDTEETYNLSRYNYYIVITSNVSSGVYSLVTLPATGPNGDNEVDHQIEISKNNGDSWSLARSELNTRALNTIPLDAHLFKLNITRGYMPSDFEIEGEETLQIENEEFLTNLRIQYPNSPDLTWGLGVWNHNFTNPIKIDILNNFRVNLTWNMTYIKGFEFDVNYTAIAYRVENATTYYMANYDYDPEWIFNYTLDLDKFSTYKWDFNKLWFVYPNYFTAHNLTTPNGTEIFSQTREASIKNIPGFLKVSISTNIINTSLSERDEFNGTYSLYLTGFNAIKDDGMYSYINYKGILWKSNGFMFGDNISISAKIQGPNNLAPKSGFINVSLFYPNGTYINNLEYSNGNLSKDGTRLSYDFNKLTIYNVTKDIPVQGTYYLGYFWTNDSIVGCNKIPIYIDSYITLLEDCTFDSMADKYLLSGTVQMNNSKDYPYGAEMLIAVVNESTGVYDPDFYSVNNSVSSEEGTFLYSPDYSGYKFQVYMSNFKQNETILNPDETIHIETTIQNRDPFYDLDVKIEVLLVSYINNQWIITNATSDTKNLKLLGDAGDRQIFSVDLELPSYDEDDLTWDGLNAPIRQGGAKTLVKVYIEDNYAGSYMSEDYSLLIPEKDDIYDAYVITLKEPVTPRTILQYFARGECIYLPENCTFIANVVNKDYMSIYNLVDFSIGLKSPIKFWNITITPEKPLEGKIFTIGANLATEFDEPLSNKEVLCQYYDGNSWFNITSGLTGSTGFTILKVDSSIRKIDASISKSFRLLWKGDNETLNGTQNFDIDIIVQTNSIKINSEDDETFVYRNTLSVIEVNLKNNGNSILKILEIDISIDVGNVGHKIKGEDNSLLDRFGSGESTTIKIELEVGDVNSDEMEVKVEVIAENIVTGEIVTVSKTINLDVVHKPLTDYFVENFIYIFLALIAFIGISALFYYRKTKKKLEKQVEEVEEKRPRRGKYVKVSELKLERPKVEEKEAEIKDIEEKKAVDLDQLLEEELGVERELIEEVKEVPVEKPPKEVVLPPKKVKKEPKKKKKPKKARISTKEMVEQKKKKKKKLGKVKKPKKPKPKKALRKKKEEPKKGKKKKSTDLDSLLEEEGLGDKK